MGLSDVSLCPFCFLLPVCLLNNLETILNVVKEHIPLIMYPKLYVFFLILKVYKHRVCYNTELSVNSILLPRTQGPVPGLADPSPPSHLLCQDAHLSSWSSQQATSTKASGRLSIRLQSRYGYLGEDPMTGSNPQPYSRDPATPASPSGAPTSMSDTALPPHCHTGLAGFTLEANT